jgi:hypothetical protein
MPVSKHRSKKSQSKEKGKTQNRPSSVVFKEHPFASIPSDIVLKGLIEIGKSQKDEFPKLLKDLEEILCSIDPLLTISVLATYGLMGYVDDKGGLHPSYKGDEFNQSHVELLQAIFLRASFFNASDNFPSPSTIQCLFDSLPELGKSYCTQRFVQLEEERSEEKKGVIQIQEELRLHTQTVRNWGFLSKVSAIVKRLCSPIEDVFQKTVGIRAEQLIDLFAYLIARNEKLISSRTKRLALVFSETEISSMLLAYHEAFPSLENTTGEMVAFATEKEMTLEQMKAMLFSHADLSLCDIYTLDVITLASETGIDAASISSALNGLSLAFGDLDKNQPEYFFLDNPIWQKPVIKLADGSYFCAMPQVFFSFIFPIFSELLGQDNLALKQYEKRRAEFLESDVSALFKKSFPDCEIGTEFTWEDETGTYENDLMVRVDSHLIIVEVKSHSVSWPALRGAPDRARKHVQQMLLDPSIQSLRLAARVNSTLKEMNKREVLLPNFPVSLDQVRTVLRLSVTLEDFGTLQTTIHHMKKANWIPIDHPIAPCILLADLEIIFDTLESTQHKIHYIKRRSDLEAHFKYKGDELDLLGFYLKSGFNIGAAEYSGDHFVLLMMSKPIDNYYSALEEGITTSKPTPRMTRWWNDICARLEERRVHQWSDIANVLLNVSFEDQEHLAKQFKKISKNVQKNWRLENHNCAITLIPHQNLNDALAIFAFKERDKDSRHTRMENVAAQLFEAGSHIERCLVIGINIDKQNYPYSILAVFFRSEESHELTES